MSGRHSTEARAAEWEVVMRPDGGDSYTLSFALLFPLLSGHSSHCVFVFVAC